MPQLVTVEIAEEHLRLIWVCFFDVIVKLQHDKTNQLLSDQYIVSLFIYPFIDKILHL